MELRYPSSKRSNWEIPNCLLVEEIFTRLPIKSLSKFKSVSKQWNSIISSSHFAHLHLLHNQNNVLNYLLVDSHGDLHTLNWASYSSRRSTNQEGLTPFTREVYTNFDPAETLFLGSCNGLVCTHQRWSYYFIWNPSTSMYRKVSYPCHESQKVRKFDASLGGLGYVASIDDYKLVQVMLFGLSTWTDVSIFSLKAGVWRHLSIDYEQLYFCVDGVSTKLGVRPGSALVNETLHWLVYVHGSGYGVCRMLAFDLAKEDIYKVPIPCIDRSNEPFVSTVKGCLCLSYLDKFKRSIEMFILEEYGVWESWKRLFRVNTETGLIGSKLPHWNLFGSCTRILVRPSDGRPHMFVEMGQHPLKVVSLPQDLYLSFSVSYVESLVSPFHAVENRASFGSQF